ncbi:MAG TPA: SpoIIE family protein phosphatase, partial [Bellilinea sp.]|nr:SpoIIE family protein phosphatase [Bellilinea sp.]
VVMCDAIGSGHNAKLISGLVVRKVLGLLSDGIRDGAAARAVSDYLFTERGGKDPAFLNILSADLETGTLVVTRNNPAPVFMAQGDQVECLSGLPQPIGSARNIRPSISEINIKKSTTVVMYTNSVMNAGTSNGGVGIDICTFLEGVLEEQDPSAQTIADSLLTQAIHLDQDQPRDDMSVTVLRVVKRPNDFIRRMIVRLPVVMSDLRESDPQQEQPEPNAD